MAAVGYGCSSETNSKIESEKSMKCLELIKELLKQRPDLDVNASFIDPESSRDILALSLAVCDVKISAF